MNQAYEVSHLLAGAMLVTSFALLYQERIAAVLNAFAAQSITLALSVAWAAWSDNRPDLFITALIALTLKGIVIPVALHRTVARLGIHREVEKVVGVGVALMVGLLAWTAKLLALAALLGVWEVSIAKMRVFRLPDFVGIAFVFGFLAILLAFLTRGVLA